MAAKPRSKLASPTHGEVYDLVIQGLSNEEIAAQLGLTTRTVKYRISGILEATGQSNRVALIAAHGRAAIGRKRQQGLRNLLAGERQASVYDLLVGGSSGPQIARRLGITPRTVKFHMSGILERTGMDSHSKLVAAHWQTRTTPIITPTRWRDIVKNVRRTIESVLDEAKQRRDDISHEIRALESARSKLRS